MAEQTEKRTYKKTLHLPRTTFSMKANLVQNEPATVKAWDKVNLQQHIREARRNSEPFVFHDGPPYANGSIHLGHLLNKVLKDFVTRTKTMAGYDTPFVPGWDCHGLPIEHKVLEEGAKGLSGEEEGLRGKGAKGLSEEGEAEDSAPQPLSPSAPDRQAIRRASRKYAQKYVKTQARQMQRLLTLADYEHPYITMDPGYEAAVLEVFAEMVSKGVVYRGLKPVHWSIDNQTALADAELEYHEKQDLSVYVHFNLTDESRQRLLDDDSIAFPSIVGQVSLMIWTTTPWTLPANMAVAVGPGAAYGLYELDGRLVVLGRDLAGDVFARVGQSTPEPIKTLTGSDLIGLTYDHPFMDDGPQPRRVVGADYVTVEPDPSGEGGSGTGMVHTAPGHGVEDYLTGLREGLAIYCPVQGDGTFDQSVPTWIQGQSVWQANDLVADHLRTTGDLFHSESFTHSYPHDWRGKTPVIFRATQQWFVDVSKPLPRTGQSIRETALEVTGRDVTFYPAWGGNRMRSMLDSRPDWCLSRQRAWGLPIPAFFGPEQGQVLLTPASVRAVGQVIAEKGSDVWFAAEPADLLVHYQAEDDPDAPDWVRREISNFKSQLTKGSDIFDVWFESGSSWHAALQRRGLAYTKNDHRPITDLYLEGSDQHRGWFQLSLLTACAVTGQSPFANLLTHGFMVDKNGRKMSKSLGNTLEVEDLLKTYGADVCRWWVFSLNTEQDVKVDQAFFQEAGEAYRKVRNTLRFLLGNLSDFDPKAIAVQLTPDDARSIDVWALNELARLVTTVRHAYDEFRFAAAHSALFDFCNHTMSAVYLTAVKDRLYCDAADSPRRRRTQMTLEHIASALIRLLSPILPHTTEEAWAALCGRQGLPEDAQQSVHLQHLPEADDYELVAMNHHWPAIMQARERWLKQIEQYRQQHEIDNPLDLGLKITVAYQGFAAEDLADLCSVSRVDLQMGDDERCEVNDLRDEPRCERSWKRDGTVTQRSDGGWLSDRDAAALGV